MTHAIAEIVVPPDSDIPLAVQQIMESFREEKEDGALGEADWYDWYKIGGRFSGHKLEASLDPAALEAFYEELKARKVTVHGMQAGKQSLEPTSQIPMVDALWRQHFPGKGDACPLFAHSRDQYRREGYYADDVCTVEQVPERLTCERLIVAWPDYMDEQRFRPVAMWGTSWWNGVQIQDTDFDGRVRPKLLEYLADEVKNAEERRAGGHEPKQGRPFGSDWLVVTVDYHA